MPVRSSMAVAVAFTLLLLLLFSLLFCDAYYYYPLQRHQKAPVLSRKYISKPRHHISGGHGTVTTGSTVKTALLAGSEPRSSDSINVKPTEQLLSSVSLIAGTTIGAGILALPAFTVRAGFVPSTLALTGTWLFMCSSGLLIAEVICNLTRQGKGLHNSDDTTSREGGIVGLLGSTEEVLGNRVAYATIVVYLFIHYALLVAYISQGGKVLNDLLAIQIWQGPTLFVMLLGPLLAFGNRAVVDVCNNIFFFATVLSYAVLVYLGSANFNVDNLAFSNFQGVWSALPVMVVALVFHNIVPAVCQQLNYEKPAIQQSIVLGSLLPLLMFILWNGVILGTGAGNCVQDGSCQNFDPVEALRTSHSIELSTTGQAWTSTSTWINIFSEGAITTSFIGFVIGLFDYYKEILPKDTASTSLSKYGTYSIVIGPPLLVALTYPDIFLNALSYTGTFGSSLLFGLVPVLTTYKLRNRNSSSALDKYETFLPGGSGALAAMAIFVAVIVAEKLVP